MQSQPLLNFTLTSPAPGATVLAPVSVQGQGYTARLASALSQQPVEFTDVFSNLMVEQGSVLNTDLPTQLPLTGLALPHLPVAGDADNPQVQVVVSDGQALPPQGQTLPLLQVAAQPVGSESTGQAADESLPVQRPLQRPLQAFNAAPAESTETRQVGAPAARMEPVNTPAVADVSNKPLVDSKLAGDTAIQTRKPVNVPVDTANVQPSEDIPEQQPRIHSVADNSGKLANDVSKAVTIETPIIDSVAASETENKKLSIGATISSAKLSESLHEENPAGMLPVKQTAPEKPAPVEKTATPDELPITVQRIQEQQIAADKSQRFVQEATEQAQANFAKPAVTIARSAQDVMRVPQQIETVADIEITATKTESGTSVNPALVQASSTTRAPLQANIPQLTLPTHIESLDWSKNFSDKVQQVLGNNVKQAEIRLDPPHLGKIDIKIDLVSERTAISFHSDQAVVRDAIDNAVNRLREQLSSAGFDKVDVDVSSGNANKHQQDQAGQQSRHTAEFERLRSGEQGAGSGEVSDDGALLSAVSASRAQSNGETASGISLYA